MQRPSRLVATIAVLVTALAGTVAATLLPGSRAGDVTDGGTPVLDAGDDVVVVGSQGLRWQDVGETTTPRLWALLEQGAAAGGATPAVTSDSKSCTAAGWLSLSAGRPVVAGTTEDGVWRCAAWDVAGTEVTGSEQGAQVTGWSGLEELQADSEYHPRLGMLADALGADGTGCATAVGPGAALALATADGTVPRYRPLRTVRLDPADAFACSLTVVDAGNVPYHPAPAEGSGRIPVPEGATAEGAARDAEIRRLDARIGTVLDAAPAGARVLVVDMGNPAPGPRSLGVGLATGTAPGDTGGPRYLASGATRWLGVFRVLDLPVTLVLAQGGTRPADVTGAPVAAAEARPSARASVNKLSELSIRDRALRGATTSMTGITTLLALAALLVVVLYLPVLRARHGTAARRLRVWYRALEVVLLGCAAAPVSIFLVALVPWWRAADPVTGLWLTFLGMTVLVAALGALVPPRPVHAAPSVLAAFTLAVLTADAVLGTPLHRASPLGSSPGIGGRFYGFGNPTYSVYTVAGVLVAAAVAALVLRRRGKIAAAVSVAVLGIAVTLIDLAPHLGADVGGALILFPVFAVLALETLGARITWGRTALVAGTGVLLVAVVGLADWMRPAASRTHLGTFVQQVIDGTAGEVLLRKAGYALGSLLAGPPAWLTLAILVWLALALGKGRLVRVAWLERLCTAWPLLRPALLALLVAAVGGALVNDYGIRIATQMLFAAVPLVALGMLRLATGETAAPGTERVSGPAR